MEAQYVRTKKKTIERRQELLKECFQLLEKIKSFDEMKILSATTQKYIQACEQHSADLERLEALYKEYQAGVAIIPLSRCPFCQQAIHHSLDTDGLDGLWWNYEASVRPDYYQNILCPHYLQISGAVRISRPIKSIPIFVSPGPEVPFVLPKLLEKESVQAVVYSIEVGEHQAYPIFYFTEFKNQEFELFNSWGHNFYKWENGEGKLIFEQSPDITMDYDFQIDYWIRQGKLFWIAPGDKALHLRSDIKDCPYLNLPGCRERQYIRNGRIRT